MKKAGFIGGMIVLGIGAMILFTYLVMLLWNWLMPDIFGLTTISIWQAAGLLILSKILFSSGHGHKYHEHRKKKYYESKFKEKFKSHFKKCHTKVGADYNEEENSSSKNKEETVG